MLSLYELKIFDTVAQAGSFSAAAQAMFLTQSSISQHIDNLEKQLGVRLFERGNRGVSVTTEGKKLERYSRQLLKLAADAEREVTRVANLENGHLRIGATVHTAGYMLPEWLQKLQGVYPNIKVSLVTDSEENLIGDLALGSLDLGFTEEDLSVIPGDIRSVTVRDSELFVMVGGGHPWFSRTQITLPELNGQSMIAFPPNSAYRRWLDHFFAAQAVAPAITAEYGEPEAIKRLVGAGQHFAMLPGCVLVDEGERQKLHMLPVTGMHIIRPVKLIWRSSIPISPVAKAFIDILAREYRNLNTIQF
ncbi:MAG: LysR family transcriptional regulator [Chloroflexi bacterium]|nr:LysR family transcriptional regulator [Chloroflexota bacterium]